MVAARFTMTSKRMRNERSRAHYMYCLFLSGQEASVEEGAIG
jgi:hypothetical protein